MEDRTKETREEFEARWLAAWQLEHPGSQYEFGNQVVSMPCTCEDGGGPTHWAAIPNDPGAIHDQELHERVLAELRDYEN